ncbi:MAG: hypothetical protein F6K17_15505 [Okeania sp. SIO3C4]|nr:hypothetical protein [Okeania sp. SIO3C4]
MNTYTLEEGRQRELISNPVEYLSYIWGWSVWSVWSVWEGWGEGEVERLKARKCG